MTAEMAIQRLRAWQSGQAISKTQRLAFPRVPDSEVLILAFIRVGGENTPCGIAYGTADCPRPTIRTIPEPRDRDRLAQMVRLWGQDLLIHLGHPSRPCSQSENAYLRQVWLPGASHLACLQLLAYGYSYVRRGLPEHVTTLKQVGRSCNYLFREAHRPGQITVMDAAQRLRSCYHIPCDDLSQQHLGVNLAWIDSQGSREQRVEAAARAVERPVSWTLDSEFERRELWPLVEQYGQQRPHSQRARALQEQIHELLSERLTHRWQLTQRARTLVLEERTENTELAPMLELAQQSYERQYARIEKKLESQPDAFFPNPETEFHPRAAAACFFKNNYCDEKTRLSLVHGDEYLLEQELAKGEALRGPIIELWDLGSGRRAQPFWRISTPLSQSLRLRVGSQVCVRGFAERIAKIRSIERVAQRRHIVLEILKQKTRPRSRPEMPDARDAEALCGTVVSFVRPSPGYQSSQRAWRVWRDEGPGAWLTQAAAPQPPSSASPTQSNLVDFVEGLGGHPQ